MMTGLQLFHCSLTAENSSWRTFAPKRPLWPPRQQRSFPNSPAVITCGCGMYHLGWECWYLFVVVPQAKQQMSCCATDWHYLVSLSQSLWFLHELWCFACMACMIYLFKQLVEMIMLRCSWIFRSEVKRLGWVGQSVACHLPSCHLNNLEANSKLTWGFRGITAQQSL